MIAALNFAIGVVPICLMATISRRKAGKWLRTRIKLKREK
jgi:hypothetical protein